MWKIERMCHQVHCGSLAPQPGGFRAVNLCNWPRAALSRPAPDCRRPWRLGTRKTGAVGGATVRFICNGGCPKDRILTTPDGEPGLNSLCEGFKAFFTHIDRPMKIMASLILQRRPPADIMAYSAVRGAPLSS